MRLKTERPSSARFEQRFLLQQAEGGSVVTRKDSYVRKFFEAGTEIFFEHDNPWWTFNQLWAHGREKFMVLFPGEKEEAVRGAMRNVWSKAVDGYGMMERRSIKQAQQTA
jgi:hypothetical protein